MKLSGRIIIITSTVFYHLVATKALHMLGICNASIIIVVLNGKTNKKRAHGYVCYSIFRFLRTELQSCRNKIRATINEYSWKHKNNGPLDHTQKFRSFDCAIITMNYKTHKKKSYVFLYHWQRFSLRRTHDFFPNQWNAVRPLQSTITSRLIALSTWDSNCICQIN